eukprot:10705982-Lingulodinium_polyedra.AAC.1
MRRTLERAHVRATDCTIGSPVAYTKSAVECTINSVWGLYNRRSCGIYNGPLTASTNASIVASKEGSVHDSTITLHWTEQRCPQ